MATEMCAFAGRMHEFFLVLKKAGFTDELIQKIINSKDNAMAREMFLAVSSGQAVEKKNMEIKSVFSKAILEFHVFPKKNRFIASEMFLLDTEINITILNDNFVKWFLPKIEKPFAGSIVCGHRLSKIAWDRQIISELGGREKAETTLTEMYDIMFCQSETKKKFINRDFGGFFYVKDINGILRCIEPHWFGSGLCFEAHELKVRYDYSPGAYIFSRNILPFSNQG